jgi:flagellar hook-associated protein 2
MAGSDILSALSAGSGFDTAAIVDALVAAERAPKQSQIDRGIEASDAKISAYGYVTSSLQSLQSAFDSLKDSSDYQWFSVNNQYTDEFMISASVDTAPGNHSISVTALASAQSTGSSYFSAADQSLNGGSSMTVTIETPAGSGSTTDIDVDSPTPQGIVDAINEAGLDVSAQLFDLGTGASPFQIVLTGQTGEDNDFTATTDAGDVAFSSSLVAAQDAVVVVDGITFQRSSNQITDIVEGTTISLQNVSAATRTFSVERNVAPVEEAIRNLVAVYNDVQTVFDTLKTAGDDTDDELAGVLSADSTFRSIRNQVKDMVTGVSSTPSGDMSYFADLGISITQYGTLEIDESALASALSTNFSDVVSALSADTENQSTYGDASRGLAGDASKLIGDLISSSGTIKTITDNARAKSAQFSIDLEDLDARMETIRARYVAQFAAMESLVDQMNNTREYLKTQLENLPFTNKNN